MPEDPAAIAAAAAAAPKEPMATTEIPPVAGANEEAKFRRLFEKTEATAKAQEAELATLRAEKQKAADAELSAQEKADKRAKESEDKATAAEERAQKAEVASLRTRLIADAGLSTKATGFITATDEAGITAQITELRSLIGANAQALIAAPKSAGTITQPGAGQTPNLDEQISAAEKAGNRNLSIALKMQKLNTP